MAHPRDVRIAELEAQIEAAKAEIAQIKADAKTEIAEVKTGDAMNLKAAAEKRGLEGQRDDDGNFITEEKGSAMALAKAASEAEISSETGEKGSGMDLTGQNKKDKVEAEDDSPLEVEVKLDPDNWLDKDETTDEESSKKRFMGSQPVESVTRDDGSELELDGGRAFAEESDVRSEKPGWEVEEGGNTWSVNEKDDYWKTEEGFDEAMNLYGQKPSWLKEPTLVYNPETDEYEEIEEEEFEDLSRPAVSADIKKLFG